MKKTQIRSMTSLRSILAFNMKAQRNILGITQAQLAERVNTSANYIALIETEKKFPTPEKLEKIADALEFDTPDLFSTKSSSLPELGTLGMAQKQILNGISEVISHIFKELRQNSQQFSDINMKNKTKKC
jgi:transcriptional regulator with XRE-family HTH domain